jgi:hypothetical protein
VVAAVVLKTCALQRALLKRSSEGGLDFSLRNDEAVQSATFEPLKFYVEKKEGN